MTEKPRGKSSAPRDADLFGERSRPALRDATGHLSWLLSRGYAHPSALKLVGDRFQLTKRQRDAVMRSSMSDAAVARRRASEIPLADLAGGELAIDGFNLLTSLETAFGGGALFRGRDGCLRDVAGVHGTWRRGPQTPRALDAVVAALASAPPARIVWFLDQPVSNSGRLAAIIAETTGHEVEVVGDADPALVESGCIVATADGEVLDRCTRWVNLVAHVVEQRIPGAWVIDLEGRA